MEGSIKIEGVKCPRDNNDLYLDLDRLVIYCDRVGHDVEYTLKECIEGCLEHYFD